MPQGVSPTWLGGKWGGLSSPLSLEREIGQRPTLTDAHPPWDLAAAFQIHPATLLHYARAKCCHALLLLWVLDKCFSPNPSFYSPSAFPFPFSPVPYTPFSCCFMFCFSHFSPFFSLLFFSFSFKCEQACWSPKINSPVFLGLPWGPASQFWSIPCLVVPPQGSQDSREAPRTHWDGSQISGTTACNFSRQGSSASVLTKWQRGWKTSLTLRLNSVEWLHLWYLRHLE